MSDERPVKIAVITRETLVPIGIAATMLLPAVGGWTWLSRQLDSIDRRLERIEEAAGGSVRQIDAEAWIKIFAARNPGLSVPPLH